MALFDSHKNFGYSTVATAPSPANSGTSLVVQSGDGAKFPAVPFNATVWPQGDFPKTSNSEIVRVTNVSTDTFTITRQAESTSARSILVGDQIANSETVKTFTDLENMFSVTTQSGDYALLTSDAVVLVNAASAPITITLPTAVGVSGKIYTIKKTDSSANNVTINTTGSQTIDGVTQQTISVQYTAIGVVSDGSNWSII